MRRLLLGLVLTVAMITAYGFVLNSLRLSEIEDRRTFIVVVTDANATEAYFWLTVYGCHADPSEDGVRCNPHGWSGRSDREWHGKQVPVPFRDAPRGVLLRFDAVVTDRQGKACASASFITTRGL